MSNNPFKIGTVEIPGPVVFHILLAWRLPLPEGSQYLPIPKAPKNLPNLLRYEPNWAICAGCYRIVGRLEGGRLVDTCSKCVSSERSNFWDKLRPYSSSLGDWAKDAIVCAVIGTVLEFNSGGTPP